MVTAVVERGEGAGGAMWRWGTAVSPGGGGGDAELGGGRLSVTDDNNSSHRKSLESDDKPTASSD
jgi:hypothetical protein